MPELANVLVVIQTLEIEWPFMVAAAPAGLRTNSSQGSQDVVIYDSMSAGGKGDQLGRRALHRFQQRACCQARASRWVASTPSPGWSQRLQEIVRFLMQINASWPLNPSSMDVVMAKDWTWGLLWLEILLQTFSTSMDSLYKEGKVAMDMLDYNQTIGRSFFLDFVVQCWVVYKDILPWCTCIDYLW